MSDSRSSGQNRAVRTGVLIFVALSVLAVCSSASGASGYGNTSVASPVRSATVPLSSYENGLVRRPNPIDGSSNLMVTGNVGAGKHFRDSLPYRSTTSMDAPLGSTALDSFMRYTAAPLTPTISSGTYRPFYSSSGTVAAMQPGTSSVFVPSMSRAPLGTVRRPVDATPDMLYSGSSPRLTTSNDAASAPGSDVLGTVPRLQLWPLSQGPEVATSGLSERFGAPLVDRRVSPPQAETLTKDDYRQQMEALQRRLGQVKAEVAQMEQSLAVRNDPSQSAADSLNRGLAIADSGLGNESESAIPEGSRREQLLQETARLLAGTTGLPTPVVRQEDDTLLTNEPDAASDTQFDTEKRLQLYDPRRALSQTRVGLAPPISSKPDMRFGGASPTLRADDERSAASSRTEKNPQSATRNQKWATAVVQPSVESPIRKVDSELAATSLKEFARHLQLAQRYFERGAYRHAAEAFALATTYRPNDPRGHLGRSHALLAAGQYDASAASLALAVELDPQYVMKKSDLIGIVGGPDAFIARFNDLDEAVQAGEAPQLQFLLAYIYCQMERPAEATAAIEAAQRASPSSISIDLLKAAIG